MVRKPVKTFEFKKNTNQKKTRIKKLLIITAGLCTVVLVTSVIILLTDAKQAGHSQEDMINQDIKAIKRRFNK